MDDAAEYRRNILRLYARYDPLVRRYLARLTRAPVCDIDDLASDVWLRVIRRLPDYADRGHPFTAWLYTICRSVVIDARRYDARHAQAPLEAARATIDGPEAMIEAWDAQAVVAALLSRLRPSQRQIIVLRYLRDYSIAQTMQATGLGKEGVKARQHRAEARMRQIAAKG